MNNDDAKKTDGNTQNPYLDRFHERLKTFPSQVGKRNPQLLGLVNYGIRAEMTDEQIESEIVKGSGEPPLTLAEIRHSLDTAHKSADAFKANASKPARPPLGPRAKDYVPQMIEIGDDTTLDKLVAMSPVAITEAGVEQTRLLLTTLYESSDLIFAGGQMEAGMPGSNIRPVADWKTQPSLQGPFLIVNPLTGEQGTTLGGKPSYRCGACIASRRYALVEFDAMALEQQACFWAGVIATGTLPLRSLVYSGGKSIHGIVEIAAKSLEDWSKELTKLMFAVANPAAERPCQADTACRNTDRLTRLAGATRPESGAMQRLLWLSPKPLGI
jgi:hypothetical protein